MRIAIVNDLPIAVETLRRTLALRPGHEIVWTAANGKEAVERCLCDKPDLILMDLLMPGLDGVQATRQIMAKSPCAILVVTFSVSSNVHKVFEAMGAGALDAAETPAPRPLSFQEGREGLGAAGKEKAALSESEAALLAKIDTMTRLLDEGGSRGRAQPHPEAASPVRPGLGLVGIGASAGGPSALASILSRLPEDFPAAVVVVQHVDEQFAKPLASWLNEQSVLPVRAAVEGAQPTPGEVLLAARDSHLLLVDSRRLGYRAQPLETFYRPSVDVFFESMARHWKGEAAGVLLTGMGRDGAVGLKRLRRAGFHTIAQDEESCAVYGMPKAAAQLQAAVEILPLEKISLTLERWCRSKLL